MNAKNKFKEKVDKAKVWWSENWPKVMVGAISVGAAVGTVVMIKDGIKCHEAIKGATTLPEPDLTPEPVASKFDVTEASEAIAEFNNNGGDEFLEKINDKLDEIRQLAFESNKYDIDIDFYASCDSRSMEDCYQYTAVYKGNMMVGCNEV